jgi:hypothetical protein
VESVHLVVTLYVDFLQGGVILTCLSSSSNYWKVFYEYWNDSGANTGVVTIATISTSTYPSLSGSVTIYYVDSSHWKLSVVAAGGTYTHTYGVSGQYINGNNNDWQNVETDGYQKGITFGSSLDWTITYPLFLESGSWVDYNGYSAPNYMLYAWSDNQPLKSTNTLGVEKIAAQGVEVFVGSGLGNSVLMSWKVGDPRK